MDDSPHPQPDEPTGIPEDPQTSPSPESWSEVSAELGELGRNLSAVLRGLAGQQAEELRTGLAGLADELNQTLKGVSEAPTVQGVRKVAGQTARDLGAYFSATFKKMNAQIEESLDEEDQK